MNEGQSPGKSAETVAAAVPGAATSGGASVAAAIDSAAPLDSDDNRARHLRRLAGHPVTLSIGLTAVIAAFVGTTIAAGPAIGAAAAAGTVLLIFLIIWVIASGQAEEDFFDAYATARGLQRAERASLPPTTPLLRKGDERYAEHLMGGKLPGGEQGVVGLYTYEEHTRDSKGNRQTSYYRFTVAMFDVPEVAQKAADIHCQRRYGLRMLDGLEDKFRRMKRLELESAQLDKHYEIFYGANDDENWMRQVFTPKFIVWLSDHAPEDFAFECSAGSLLVNVKKHRKSAADLDSMCEAAAAVVHRLRGEAVE